MTMTLNEGILHFWPLAKYAVAFPGMSRSTVTRASSARNRVIAYKLIFAGYLLIC